MTYPFQIPVRHVERVKVHQSLGDTKQLRKGSQQFSAVVVTTGILHTRDGRDAPGFEAMYWLMFPR